MSLREEQCKKVCRILDDVLANRPTERDSLIVATRSAFSALSEPHWIPVTERLPENEKRVLILNDDNLYMIGFIREYDCWNEWRYQYEMYDDDVYEEEEQGKIVAWMPLPEHYKVVTT